MNAYKLLESNTRDEIQFSKNRFSGKVKWLEFLQSVVQILRSENPHWQHDLIYFLSIFWNFPELTTVRIQIGNREYCANRFANSSQSMITPLNLANGLDGFIEIGQQSEDQLERLERQQVLDSIGELIGFAVNTRVLSETLNEKENALRSSNDRIKDLAGRLIQAQEAERTRIARDLHDNVNQQIAALSISLSDVKKKLNGSSSQVVEDISLLQRQLSAIADEVRSVSQNLHPGVLQHTGLVMAARSLCTEFSNKNGIELEFGTEGDVDAIPDEIALCVYRVIQEAIHNIQVHAKARHVKVCLVLSETSFSLLVSDDGCGFDVSGLSPQKCLGLLSMNERVRQINGQISIDSQIDRGTQLRIEIPV